MRGTHRVDLGIYLVGCAAALCSLAVSFDLALYVHASINVFAVVVVTRGIVRKVETRKREDLRSHPPLGCLFLFLLLYVTAWEIAHMSLMIIVALLLVLVVAGVAGRLCVRYVPAGHVGVVRRLHGRAHPEFPHVTPYATHGVLARTLLPGRHWRPPFLYQVQCVPRTHVAEGKIGLVTAKEGRARLSGRALARAVSCDNFQNGEDFLLKGGEAGTQVGVLAGGQSYSINTELFEVQEVDRTHVPTGTIGLVDAKAGKIPPPGSLFGPYVECDDFQDGGRFLDGGGQQGKQLAILPGGAYYDINPALFDVITTYNVGTRGGELTEWHLKEVSIPADQTGVVIALDGAQPEGDRPGPSVPGHQGYRLPWVFLQNGGWRGVQEETLSGGTVCALNPYFVRVMLIPTHLLTLEWDEKTPGEELTNYDAHLGRITATVQGYRLFVDVRQLLRIPAESAPELVRRNGGGQFSGIGGLHYDRLPVQRFVQRVLGAIVASYFSQIATALSVQDFLRNYRETRLDLAALVENELREWGVESRGTHLGEFRAEDEALNEMLQKPAFEEMRSELLTLQQGNAEREDAIDVVRMRAEKRRKALDLKAEIEALGLDNVMVLRMLKEITQAPVPQFISGGDVSAFLETQPVSRLEGLLEKMRNLNPGIGAQSTEQPSLPRTDADPGDMKE